MAIHAAGMAVSTAPRSLYARINSDYHEVAMKVFLAVVLAHWGEHLIQGVQIYLLGWPVPESRGVVGYFFPWLIASETLHYGYAVVMLAGLFLLRSGFSGSVDHFWWMTAFWIQFFHHIEHAILQTQALIGVNLFGRPVPTSLIQLWVPRVELHLFYNTIVFVPMAIAMFYHLYPPATETARPRCLCAAHAGGETLAPMEVPA